MLSGCIYFVKVLTKSRVRSGQGYYCETALDSGLARVSVSVGMIRLYDNIEKKRFRQGAQRYVGTRSRR